MWDSWSIEAERLLAAQLVAVFYLAALAVFALRRAVRHDGPVPSISQLLDSWEAEEANRGNTPPNKER